jgi:predicted nucleic acid-binding protein
MSGNKVFIDTNILVYAYSTSDTLKQQKSKTTLLNNECIISTQVLNEFCNVCFRKLRLPVALIKRDIAEITDICDCWMVDYSTIQQALVLQEQYGFSYYDCLIIASAVETGCAYLFTEDLTDGQKIDNVIIRNIFN